MSTPDRDFDVAACRLCGCTEDAPCEGGCMWVYDPDGDLCSRCLDGVHAALASVLPALQAALGTAPLSQVSADLAVLARWADVPDAPSAPTAAPLGPVERAAAVALLELAG